MEKFFDPLSVQMDIIHKVEKASGVTLKDPNNSFALMLEVIGDTVSSYATSAEKTLRNTFVSTAETKEALLRHATGEELVGFYATPATARITFLVNAIDVLDKGLVSDISEHAKYIRLSKFTSILIPGYEFTLLNDLKIHYDGHRVVVEQFNVTDHGINDLGNIAAYIIRYENTDFIRFEIDVKQFSLYEYTHDVVGPVNFRLPINDSYWFSEILYKDDMGVSHQMALTASDIVFDPYELTAKIDVQDNYLNIEIPNEYQFSGIMPDKLYIKIYETKGKLSLRLSEFDTSDFKLKRNQLDTENSEVTIYCGSEKIVSGGSDKKTLEEIRESIIKKTTGPLYNQITFNQLKERAARDGYDLSLFADYLTHRLFVVNKNIDPEVFTSTNSDITVFSNTTIFSDFVENEFISRVNGDREIVVRKNCPFIDYGEYVKPHNDPLLIDTIKKRGGYSDLVLTDTLAGNRLFFTPYTNIVYEDNTAATFDLDATDITDLQVISRNTYTSSRISPNDIKVSLEDGNYFIRIDISGIENDSKVENVMGQLSFTTKGGAHVFYNNIEDGTVDKPLVFKIPTNSYVDLSDNLSLTANANGLDITVFTKLVTNMQLVLFVAGDITNSIGIYGDDLLNDIGYGDVTPLSVSRFNVQFGLALKEIFNRSGFRYTERKYKTYEEDIPYIYEHNVYAFEADDYFVHGDLDDRILHFKGEVKLDENGDVVYKHRRGDIMLNDAGLPIVDEVFGSEILTNLIMFELEYLVTNNIVYLEAIETAKKYILEFSNFTASLRFKALESTDFKFLPKKSNRGVKIEVGSVTKIVPQVMRPVLKLFVDSRQNFNLDIVEIGRALEKCITKKEIYKSDLRDAVVKGPIKACSIESLGIGVDEDYFVVKENEFSIGKKLTSTKDVDYDIEVIVSLI